VESGKRNFSVFYPRTPPGTSISLGLARESLKAANVQALSPFRHEPSLQWSAITVEPLAMAHRPRARFLMTNSSIAFSIAISRRFLCARFEDDGDDGEDARVM